MWMLNNRELAAVIWLGVATLWILSTKGGRRGFVGIATAFLKLQILIPLIAMLAWVGLELWVGARLALWNPTLANSTILWTLGSAGVLFFNCTEIDSDLHFFRQTIVATVRVAVFVEFFVNLYVMSLPLELIVQIIVLALSLMVAVGDQKPEYKPAKVFLEWVLVVIGLALIIFSVRQIYLDWHQLDTRGLLLEFMLPIWLTVGLLPFLYVFSTYLVYDSAFRRINWEAKDRRSRWRSRLALLSVLHFRTDIVRKTTGYLYLARELSETRTFSAARGVVGELFDRLKRAEQKKINEKEGLRRYTGSQDLDDEGRQLDRREFAETIDALQWLATCQMGWYRRDDRYRNDMLKILGDKFIRQGLPQESGITLHVAKNGQSWYAWRRTVTGWCFAIGAAGPPPDEWKYDGPEPPQGFPGKDSVWGNGPFSDQVNCNWR